MIAMRGVSCAEKKFGRHVMPIEMSGELQVNQRIDTPVTDIILAMYAQMPHKMYAKTNTAKPQNSLRIFKS